MHDGFHKASERQVARPRFPDVAPVQVALIGCGAISKQMYLPVLSGHEGLWSIGMRSERRNWRAGMV
jgi:hypothetical protein